MRTWFKRARGATALAAAGMMAMAAPQAAPAQLFLGSTNFRSGPIEPNDPMVGLAIPGATPAEYRAHLLWNLRSGLNVAALQCQFSPYLRAVPNYNAILAHHSTELARAYTALEGYFRRKSGAQGPRRFDQYSTSTYNNFSTLQAQYGFCQTAASISREALTRKKGELHLTAASRMRELRNSLVPASDRPVLFNAALIRQPVINTATLARDCSRLRGSEKRACEAS